MSTATAFKYYRPFPFCLNDIIPSGTDNAFDYVGGLTLAQIMNVWWNLESIAVVSTGDPNNGFAADINISLVAPPDVDSILFPNSFIDASNLTDPRSPVSRVCVSSDFAVSFSYQNEYAPSVPRVVRMDLKVIIDPDDPASYGIAYTITSECRSTLDSGAVITNPADGIFRFTGDAEFSGTIDFGGIEFNWVGGPVIYTAIENVGFWTIGGTDFSISVTPSFFTY